LNGPRFWSVVVVVAISVAAAIVVGRPAPIVQPPAATVADRVAAPPLRYRTESRTVRAGDTAGSVLRAMGGPTEALLAGAGSTLNRLRPGDVLHLDWRTGEPQPFRLRLDGPAAYTQELVREGDRYVARQVPIPYLVEDRALAVTVRSSLWAAATAAGFAPAQIMGLATIFEYDVDFNTELYAGARFRLVLDELTADDGTKRVGNIRAAILENGGKEYVAIRHLAADGAPEWYDARGGARKKAFLRSPLEFSRVTSGFSTGRYHPVLHKMRAHKGVDLAAPSGTPIRSVADGVVTRAGWAGGHGNHIEVKHEGGYSTGYSHLSSMSVKAGERVRQGQFIGRVGSTGLSTGPHLHYEFKVNGVNRDPLKAIVPVSRPLAEGELPAFYALRDSLLPRLAAAVDAVAAEAEEAAEAAVAAEDAAAPPTAVDGGEVVPEAATP
jgi:murein DD-endopeptidase MepM/ murein hydrolase activator NlpD